MQANHEAMTLLASRRFGVLSTHSTRHPGYPLGSVTPYVLDQDGQPVILISDIAQHTINLTADPRCSLTLTAVDSGDVQANARLSLLTDAQLMEQEGEAVDRYLRFFPEAQGHFQAHNFRFWRLRPQQLRYIGGFGRIHWLDPDETLISNPFAGSAEAFACEHMNADHTDALIQYCAHSMIEHQVEAPTMVGVDAQALYLRACGRIHRLAFRRHLHSLQELREETIAMCQPAYWQRRLAA